MEGCIECRYYTGSKTTTVTDIYRAKHRAEVHDQLSHDLSTISYLSLTTEDRGEMLGRGHSNADTGERELTLMSQPGVIYHQIGFLRMTFDRGEIFKINWRIFVNLFSY